MFDAGDSDGLLLLDTHIWVWAFHAERARFGEAGALRLESAALRGLTRVSAISVWEVARLVARGRITIGVSIDDWVARAIAAFGGVVVPIDRRIALDSTRLPDLEHRDPADRFLIATARALGATLITVDDIVLAYGAAGHVSVLDPRG